MEEPLHMFSDELQLPEEGVPVPTDKTVEFPEQRTGFSVFITICPTEQYIPPTQNSKRIINSLTIFI
jgi:hypothetical protein